MYGFDFKKLLNYHVHLLNPSFHLIFSAAFIHYLNQVPEVAMPLSQFRHCNVVFVFVVFTFLCSTYLIIAMTFERFYSIIRPHKAASFNTVKKARIIIMCIVISSVFYSIPYFFISGNFGKICISNRFASDNIYGELFYWVTQIVYFVIPFLSLLTMNSVIIHTLRKRSEQLNLSESIDEGQTEGQKFKTKNIEKQIFITVLLITFVFLILNTPALTVVFYLIFYTGNTPYYHAGLFLYYQISEKTYITNHGINFFLYVISGQKFRRDLRNLFFSKKSNMNRLDSSLNTISSTISSVEK